MNIILKFYRIIWDGRCQCALMKPALLMLVECSGSLSSLKEDLHPSLKCFTISRFSSTIAIFSFKLPGLCRGKAFPSVWRYHLHGFQDKKLNGFVCERFVCENDTSRLAKETYEIFNSLSHYTMPIYGWYLFKQLGSLCKPCIYLLSI